MKSLKDWLLACNQSLEKGDFENLLGHIREASRAPLTNLSLEEARECLELLEQLVNQAENLRLQVSETLEDLEKIKAGILTLLKQLRFLLLQFAPQEPKGN